MLRDKENLLHEFLASQLRTFNKSEWLDSRLGFSKETLSGCAFLLGMQNRNKEAARFLEISKLLHPNPEKSMRLTFGENGLSPSRLINMTNKKLEISRKA